MSNRRELIDENSVKNFRIRFEFVTNFWIKVSASMTNVNEDDDDKIETKFVKNFREMTIANRCFDEIWLTNDVNEMIVTNFLIESTMSICRLLNWKILSIESTSYRLIKFMTFFNSKKLFHASCWKFQFFYRIKYSTFRAKNRLSMNRFNFHDLIWLIFLSIDTKFNSIDRKRQYESLSNDEQDFN